MELKELIKFELKNWGKLEKIFFPLILFATVIISFLIKDDKIALVSALCGMSYTILAGKGKISCYFIGMIGTFCYSYIAFINGFYGNLCLYMLYYFPMEIVGIYKWRKQKKPENREVKKSRLSNKERIIYSLIAIIISISLSIILKLFNGITPYIDGTVTTLSVIGQLLTVKRCVEQWYVWFIVNLLSLIMWIFAYINDSNCFATIIMWAVYVVLSIYFLQTWQKELKQN